MPQPCAALSGSAAGLASLACMVPCGLKKVLARRRVKCFPIPKWFTIFTEKVFVTNLDRNFACLSSWPQNNDVKRREGNGLSPACPWSLTFLVATQPNSQLKAGKSWYPGCAEVELYSKAFGLENVWAREPMCKPGASLHEPQCIKNLKRKDISWFYMIY